MIGIIPSHKITYEIFGSLDDTSFIEGKLYYDPKDERLFFYSKIETRSNPNTGYFPVWDGENKFISKFSNEKYLSDSISMNISNMMNKIDKDTADDIKYRLMSSDTRIKVLKPQISNEDNMFTQCIKGIISDKNITIVDLFNMGLPVLNKKTIENYYNALNKISFMRYSRWTIWINDILHLRYKIKIFRDNEKILEYNYPKDEMDIDINKYKDIIKEGDDPFKKIVKILMVVGKISKESMRKECSDDYTVNNLLTTISSKKPLSAQLFSRFISITKLNYVLEIYENEEMIFSYKE